MGQALPLGDSCPGEFTDREEGLTERRKREQCLRKAAPCLNEKKKLTICLPASILQAFGHHFKQEIAH